MQPYLFDATALVKLVVDEQGSRAIRQLCSTPEVIRTTWLCLAEAYGVVKRHWQKEKWTAERYCGKIFDLQHYVQRRIKLEGSINLSQRDFRETERIHGQYRIDFSDALLVVVLRSGLYAHLTGNSKPVLVTSDKNLFRAARAEGIMTWNPENEKSLMARMKPNSALQTDR
jgi:predicted nucleic acid-binding protein